MDETQIPDHCGHQKKTFDLPNVNWQKEANGWKRIMVDVSVASSSSGEERVQPKL